MQVTVRLLGGFGVTVDGRPVPEQTWRRRSAAALVKLLALQPGHRLLRDQVVDALWPELLVDEALPRLHKATHQARAGLGSPDSIVAGGGVIALFPHADVLVDSEEFERAADEAGDGHQGAARDAAARYAGVLLPDDLYEPWTEESRSRLRLRYLELLRIAGRYEELVAADPLDEAAHLALVRSQVDQGRRSAALRSLDRWAEALHRELGVEPGPQASELRRAAEALPLDAAPAASSGRGRSVLPARRHRLIGRQADVARVGELLQAHRLVTITGPGGAGKSTLALEVARAARSEESADVVLAELAPVRDAAGVTRAVAESAGVQGEGAVQNARLAANLGRRATLLVLDNCEHLVDASADLVDAMLDAGQEVRVLVTSREPLGVDGEVVHRIGSLGADAAELFVERAVAAAGPEAADLDDPKVAELCERLDGLPLAIELAAAQLAHLSLAELTDRLDDRLALLVGGRPRAGGRHSALTATIEWSYRLLSSRSADLFERLGVFPAGFDLEEVEAVAGADAGAVLPLLGGLVSKSLVVHDPFARRYRLLETIRLFAAQRLDEAGSGDDVAELLRQHVIRRSRTQTRVRTWLSTSAAARSRDDLENVRLAFERTIACGDLPAAVDIALGISTLWRNAVSYAEGRRWVSALTERELSPHDRLWTLILTADVGLGSGDPRMMRAAAEQAAALSAEIEDPAAAVIAGIYDAMTHLALPGRSAERLQAARDQARALGEPGLDELARGFRLVALTMLGRSVDLEEEVRDVTERASRGDYSSYLRIWATSCAALVQRDGARLRRLMDAQLVDLTASGLEENWLTEFWDGLTMIAGGEDYLPQLRLARRRAETEGRRAEPDLVHALAYADACREDWEEAAELLGAAERWVMDDTASYIHHILLRDRLVRPQLAPETFDAACERGSRRTLAEVLRQRGF